MWITNMMIDSEIKSSCHAGKEFCTSQSEASVAIEERMNELSDDMLEGAMKDVLKLAMKESYEVSIFAVAMQQVSEEYLESILI